MVCSTWSARFASRSGPTTSGGPYSSGLVTPSTAASGSSGSSIPWLGVRPVGMLMSPSLWPWSSSVAAPCGTCSVVVQRRSGGDGEQHHHDMRPAAQGRVRLTPGDELLGTYRVHRPVGRALALPGPAEAGAARWRDHAPDVPRQRAPEPPTDVATHLQGPRVVALRGGLSEPELPGGLVCGVVEGSLPVADTGEAGLA